MNLTPDTIGWAIDRLGIPIILVIAFIKGWIVPSYVYTQLLNSEKEFRQITLRNAELADRALSATERVVEGKRNL